MLGQTAAGACWLAANQPGHKTVRQAVLCLPTWLAGLQHDNYGGTCPSSADKGLQEQQAPARAGAAGKTSWMGAGDAAAMR